MSVIFSEGHDGDVIDTSGTLDTSGLIAVVRDPKRSTPKWKAIAIAIGIAMSMWVAPAVIPASAPVVGSVSAEHNAPADAKTKPSAKCTYWVAGWVQQTRPCKSGKDLPREVKQCLFGIFGALLVADMFGAPLAPAAASALVGCGGSLIK